MSRFTFVAALAASAVMAMAQSGSQSYTPAVPAASTFNGYGGVYGGSYGGGTVAGSAMQGMASVISAQGNYNLSTSAAAINMTQAQRNDIQNRQEWTRTYFDMRATQRAAVASERGPPPSQEQIARMAAAGVPRPLGSHEVDPVSGQVAWPGLLQDNLFAQQRGQIEQLLSKHAQYGRLGISDSNQFGAAVEGMSASLKEQVRNVPPQQYVVANNFLRSLMYNVTHKQL